MTFAGLGAVLAVAWFAGASSRQLSEPLEVAGIYLSEPKKLADFELLDDAKQTFTREDFKGRWHFLYFGYTYCPDACPLALAQLNKAEQQFDEALKAATSVYLVSVDPRRDTPERLAEYTRFFNPAFRGMSGEPGELDKLAKPLGIYYSVPENPEDPENYLVDHSAAIVLLNPDGELQALFTPPHDPQRIAADFAAIRQRYEAAN